MNMLRLLFFCFICCHAIPTCAATYAVAHSATPVLNTSAFSGVFGGVGGKSLKTDHCGQVRELEFIALPGTVFAVLAEIRDGRNNILKVETDEYPGLQDTALYLDSRFTELYQEKPPPRARQLPPQTEILDRLKAAIGSPYVWGGNVQGGVKTLFDLYFDAKLSGPARKHLALAGLDCSGLLYQATGGWTPRNTAQLLSFGTSVAIEGKTLKEIAESVEPLDMIVWNGHVIIVLDRETVIESRLRCNKPERGGVIKTSLKRRLADIMLTRRPIDNWPLASKQQDIFVVRRWYVP